MTDGKTISEAILERNGHRCLIYDGEKIIMRIYGAHDYCETEAAKFMSPKHTFTLTPFCGRCESYHTIEERPQCQSA